MSLVEYLVRKRIGAIKRKRFERIMREIARRYDGIDPYKKMMLVAVENALSYSIGWNRDRNKAIKKKIESIL